MRLGVFPAAASTPTSFSVRGFETISLHWNPGLRGLSHSPFVPPGYLHADVGLPTLPDASSPGPPATTLLRVLSTRLLLPAPPLSLNECIFFNSLVVRLLYSSTFCQFWLYFVFKFVVVLLLLVQGGIVYLSTLPSWPEVTH